MNHKDYYKVMGVSSDATDKDIKLAYRRLARKYHPDISKEKDAEDHFKEVGEAYEVLKDPQKRKVYDQYMHDLKHGQQSRQSTHRAAHDTGQAQYQSSYDFFESLFGAPHFQEPPPTGMDLRGSIQVTLEEAVHGAIKEIQIPGVSPSKDSQILRVKIPAGVTSGQQIRLSGQGALGGASGVRGDLYITINVNKHPVFDVMGRDVYVTLPITPWEAALGAVISVPTLGGKVELKIPPGSQGGQKLRLNKRGLPGAEPGSQYVILKIITPKPTTEAARELYRKMAEEMPMDPRAQMGVS
jgi:curved DNA-binding protein